MLRLFAALLLVCLPVLAQPDLQSRLEGKISALLAQSGAPSVSVAVVQDGRLAYAKAFGSADLEAKRPATTETRYAIGSVSKQFTAVALLLLQEAGKLTMDDKVAKFFPDLTRSGEVTIRQLLSHTSGYEDYAPQDYIIPAWKQPTTSRAILDTWAKKPLNYDPGTRYQYSNTGYVIAAQIVHAAAGMPLNLFLKQKVFDPLGMASAGDCSASTPHDAKAYTRYALGPPRAVAREGAGWYDGAGQLCMTPSDVAKWNIAVLEKRILSPGSYEELTREVKLANGQGTGYALGLVVRGGGSTLSHTGEVSGFLTSNTVDLARRSAVTVCSNQDGTYLFSAVAREVDRTLNDEAAEVRHILEQLMEGRIDRAKFTSNANAYFSELALLDIRNSLAPLGRLQSVTRNSEGLRGGMRHLGYSAQFDKKKLTLNIYRMPDGKWEQFLIVESF